MRRKFKINLIGSDNVNITHAAASARKSEHEKFDTVLIQAHKAPVESITRKQVKNVYVVVQIKGKPVRVPREIAIAAKYTFSEIF